MTKPDKTDAQAVIVTFTANPALDLSSATEHIVPTEKLRCGEFHLDPGGGGINVARAVTFLGGRALAIFPAGGWAGATLATLLGQEGIPHRRLAIAGETRQDLTFTETSSGLQYRFIMPGPQLSGDELEACEAALRQLETRPAFLVASGSLPPGAPEDWYCRIVAIARELGAKAILDCSGRPLAAAVAQGGIYLLKASLSELETLAGVPLPDEAAQIAAARAIVARGGAETVVVSLGAAGALLVHGEDETLRYPAIPVDVKSAIGAGDSLVAGLVLGLARGYSLDDSMKLGMAAAASSVTRPGTQLCRIEDIDTCYRAITPPSSQSGQNADL